jgi:GNAT superfamily N-acetyltransferase
VPIGWCSVAPREEFTTLERSRILKPVDNQSVWSIVCFFVNKKFRNQGLSIDLINVAKEFVWQNGGKILEGYPVEPKKGKTADVFAYTGLASAFRKAGFVEVTRRSETRPIMRYYLQ